jgi:hypothetical protein
MDEPAAASERLIAQKAANTGKSTRLASGQYRAFVTQSGCTQSARD